MKNVRVALITTVVAMAFALTACGGDGVVKKYSKIVDEMCKCKDKACVDKIETKSKKMKKQRVRGGKRRGMRARGGMPSIPGM